jgi:hypothetical protein
MKTLLVLGLGGMQTGNTCLGGQRELLLLLLLLLRLCAGSAGRQHYH